MRGSHSGGRILQQTSKEIRWFQRVTSTKRERESVGNEWLGREGRLPAIVQEGLSGEVTYELSCDPQGAVASCLGWDGAFGGRFKGTGRPSWSRPNEQVGQGTKMNRGAARFLPSLWVGGVEAIYWDEEDTERGRGARRSAG